MNYLTLEDAITIHNSQTQAFGGRPGILDIGLVTAAVLTPENGFFDDIIEEAAAMWVNFTMNGGFVSGNETTGFACTEIFLDINGYELNEDHSAVADFILSSLRLETFTKRDVEIWLRGAVSEKS